MLSAYYVNVYIYAGTPFYQYRSGSENVLGERRFHFRYVSEPCGTPYAQASPELAVPGGRFNLVARSIMKYTGRTCPEAAVHKLIHLQI